MTTALRDAAKAHPGGGIRPGDWTERTTGTAEYVSDVRLPGMLVGGILRSPHQHATIRRIDTRAARRVPGVAAVITGPDFPDRTYRGLGGNLSDRYPMARDVVRYHGEEVAAVAAQTHEQVAEALGAIKARYRRLGHVQTVPEASRPGAARVHETSERGNVGRSREYRFGTPAAAQPGDVSVRARYFTGRHGHACMEPHCVVAWWHGERAEYPLELWVPTQSPTNAQAEMAHVFGLDEEQIRVHRTAVGGDFGARVKPGDIEAIAIMLSKVTGRPVKLQLDREQEFALTKHRYQWEIDLMVSARPDGELLDLRAVANLDLGAYSHVGAGDLGYTPIALGSAYRAASYEMDVEAIYTNKRPPGAFRGAGVPAATFARECAIDELADELGMDPGDLRMRNAFHDGETTLTGWQLGTARMTECIALARERIGWAELRAQRGSGRGVGLAASAHVTGWGSMRASAAIDLLPGGRIRARSGCADPGTGQRMVVAAVAGRELGIDPQTVEVILTDSATTPHDPGAGASRGTFLTGNAVGKAAAQMALELREAAAPVLGVAAHVVELKDGVAHGGGHEVDFAQLATLAGGAAGEPYTVETEVVYETEEPRDGYGHLGHVYSFAANAVELTVDRRTGRVDVVNVVAVHDSGHIINPVAARGQVIGGVVMALGAALGEELIFTQGRIANAGYLDYALPRAADAPPVDVAFLDSADPGGRYGTKGVAEIALALAGAAVANAVAHAVGVRVRALPITPDKVLRLLRSAAHHG